MALNTEITLRLVNSKTLLLVTVLHVLRNLIFIYFIVFIFPSPCFFLLFQQAQNAVIKIMSQYAERKCKFGGKKPQQQQKA